MRFLTRVQLTENTERILEENELFQGPNRDFVERQRAYDRMRKQELVRC